MTASRGDTEHSTSPSTCWLTHQQVQGGESRHKGEGRAARGKGGNAEWVDNTVGPAKGQFLPFLGTSGPQEGKWEDKGGGALGQWRDCGKRELRLEGGTEARGRTELHSPTLLSVPASPPSPTPPPASGLLHSHPTGNPFAQQQFQPVPLGPCPGDFTLLPLFPGTSLGPALRSGWGSTPPCLPPAPRASGREEPLELPSPNPGILGPLPPPTSEPPATPPLQGSQALPPYLPSLSWPPPSGIPP